MSIKASIKKRDMKEREERSILVAFIIVLALFLAPFNFKFYSHLVMNALLFFVETFKLNSREHQLTGFTAAASCPHNEHGAA